MRMDELNQQWAVTLEEKHEPITILGGHRGGGKIFFLENMVKFLKEQLKQEQEETERWKSAALYYAERLGKAQKWIPVTERLPEQDGAYLVFRKWHNFTYTEVWKFSKDARTVDKYDFTRKWENVWYEYDSEVGHYTTEDVTHWMPLPEPPKGE